MLGLEVKAVSEILPDRAGQVMCHGEIWSARTDSGRLLTGSCGVVKALDGMTLIISQE